MAQDDRPAPSSHRRATKALLQRLAAEPLPCWSLDRIDAYLIRDPRTGFLPASDVVGGDVAVWNLSSAFAKPASEARMPPASKAWHVLEPLPREVVDAIPRALRYRFTVEGQGMWSLRAWMCRYPEEAYPERFECTIARIVGLPSACK